MDPPSPILHVFLFNLRGCWSIKIWLVYCPDSETAGNCDITLDCWLFVPDCSPCILLVYEIMRWLMVLLRYYMMFNTLNRRSYSHVEYMLTVIHIPMLSGCFHVAGAVMDIFMVPVPCLSYFLGRFHRNFVDFSRPIYPMDWLPEKMTSDYRLYLVGGLEQWIFYDFPYIGNVIIPTDELMTHTFQRGKFNPPTSYRLYRLCPECFLRLCPDFGWSPFCECRSKIIQHPRMFQVRDRAKVPSLWATFGDTGGVQLLTTSFLWASLAPKIMNRKLEHMGRMSDRMSVSMPERSRQNLK